MITECTELNILCHRWRAWIIILVLSIAIAYLLCEISPNRNHLNDIYGILGAILALGTFGASCFINRIWRHEEFQHQGISRLFKTIRECKHTNSQITEIAGNSIDPIEISKNFLKVKKSSPQADGDIGWCFYRSGWILKRENRIKRLQKMMNRFLLVSVLSFCIIVFIFLSSQLKDALYIRELVLFICSFSIFFCLWEAFASDDFVHEKYYSIND